MRIPHYGFSHPGYMIPPSEDKLPFVRIGVLVTCDQLGASPSTSDLRGRFLAFLGRPSVSELVNGLTYVGDDLTWRSYAGNGRIHNEAVLTASDEQTDAPVVSAMMNPTRLVYRVTAAIRVSPNWCCTLNRGPRMARQRRQLDSSPGTSRTFGRWTWLC